MAIDLRHRLATPTPGLRAVRDLLLRLRLWLAARLWALRAAPARRRLRAAVPGLRRVAVGPVRLYGGTVAGYTAAQAAAADLEQVCALLEAAGVPYFLVPAEQGPGVPRPVVGVEESYRAAVLAGALRHFARSAAYVGAVGADGAVTSAVLWADGRLPRALRGAPVLRAGLVRLGPGGQVLGGLETGCDIEFWRYGRDLGRDPAHLTVPGTRLQDDFGPSLVAPRRNAVSEVLPAGAWQPPGAVPPQWSAIPAEQSSAMPAEQPWALPADQPSAMPAMTAEQSSAMPVEQLSATAAPQPSATAAPQPSAVLAGAAARRPLPTFPAFAEPGIDQVCFPVDAVYTWVDGDDPVMAVKRRAHQALSHNAIAPRETGASRYTSHDELRYALRSLEMYAGFIRHVYLVTDSQTPSWLDPEAEGLTVVDHRDILPADALPVFNSHAIESRLHHIPGLSEHYLYFNDDVFINRPVGAERFFHGNGIARIPLSPLKLGVGAPHPLEPAPNSAGKNAREVIRRFHGRYVTHKSLHTPHPQLLSVMREMEGLGIEELERTSYSRFRSTTDVAPASTLHHHWAIATGRAVPAEYSFRYVQLGTPDMRRRLARLAAGEDVDFFCLNDVDTAPADRVAAQEAIRAFLERKYPFPSRFERAARTASYPAPAPARRGRKASRRRPAAARLTRTAN
ncbi:stealth conserved region 3 domain-containing protein [Streptomyces cinerochromogenes]|uniref:stealth conserved region 3 domain-containing protein n=1 Tax=Streptomyces cinerochromogenes TaxID=66422 RepID=UPI0019828242|nr:stealth conserved region 3 domain-containing protein [Streptomyces cinerochromogenes]GGS51887.1 exopolysaccharide phosphotransferase [Streptomyces cinerochromogenes]